LRILAIESSCDETAAAVIEDGRSVVSNVVHSQIDLHARYGGVVPEVASRQHVLTIVPVIRRALEGAGGWDGIEAIAVTQGPGLAGSLVVGVNAAKGLALARGLPLVPVNHLEGHIYANWLHEFGAEDPRFPLLCLIVSGGHTDLMLMRGHGDYRRLGRTRDDAAGEAFDKVGRLLGLPFPGGPAIEKAATGVRPSLRLPRAWLRGTEDFSFSGLKTAVLRLVSGEGGAPPPAEEVAAAFQDAVCDVLAAKAARAASEHGAVELLLAGGVAANGALRRAVQKRSPVPVRIPPPKYCTDNAAMIGAAGCFRFQAGLTSAASFDVIPTMRLV
jgi:N6-L-threonylcarbamoyladenine synthase